MAKKKLSRIDIRQMKGRKEEVRNGEFPEEKHTYKMVEGELAKLEKLLK